MGTGDKASICLICAFSLAVLRRWKYLPHLQAFPAILYFPTHQKKVDQVPALGTAAYQAFREEGRFLRQSILAGTRTINSKALCFLPAFSFKN